MVIRNVESNQRNSPVMERQNTTFNEGIIIIIKMCAIVKVVC